MWRYGSLGLSKPHLEPIIGVILSQFNQSKRDWWGRGWKGAQTEVEGVGQMCWLQCVCRESNRAPTVGGSVWLEAALHPTDLLVPAYHLLSGLTWNLKGMRPLFYKKSQKNFKATSYYQGFTDTVDIQALLGGTLDIHFSSPQHTGSTPQGLRTSRVTRFGSEAAMEYLPFVELHLFPDWASSSPSHKWDVLLHQSSHWTEHGRVTHGGDAGLVNLMLYQLQVCSLCCSHSM